MSCRFQSPKNQHCCRQWLGMKLLANHQQKRWKPSSLDACMHYPISMSQSNWYLYPIFGDFGTRSRYLSQAWKSNCIPQYSVGCNYLSIPEIPASGTKVLILKCIIQNLLFTGHCKNVNIHICWCTSQMMQSLGQWGNPGAAPTKRLHPWSSPWYPGPRLNIKTVLSTYGDFHVKDKTAVRTSYL